MARKRYSDEDILNLLRQIELDLNGGSDVGSACRKSGNDGALQRTSPSQTVPIVHSWPCIRAHVLKKAHYGPGLPFEAVHGRLRC